MGQLYRTPFEPSGLVELIEVYPPWYEGRKLARVRFVGDHPHGYEAGETGCYFLDELRPVEPDGDGRDRPRYPPDRPRTSPPGPPGGRVNASACPGP